MEGAISAFRFRVGIESGGDHNYVRLRRQFLRIRKHVAAFGDDSHAKMPAVPAGVAVMLENYFVRIGIES